MSKAVLLIHGGAGRTPINVSKQHEIECKEVLHQVLELGYSQLQKGYSSLDVVETAIKALEDFPGLNAGKGAVIANSGRCELDASIMEGEAGKAGAVANITRAKNPISVARAIMEKSKYVLFAGDGADAFAEQQQLEIVNPEYFITEAALARWKKAQIEESEAEFAGLGTVGAVAVDLDGNLAAGTSTGGLINKQTGRIGDSAIIGAGTYADNASCAVSCTGNGEIFMRNVVAYDIAALIKYRRLSVQEAAEMVINQKLGIKSNAGGAIILDKDGNYAMPFNTEIMIRGFITNDGVSKTFIYD